MESKVSYWSEAEAGAEGKMVRPRGVAKKGGVHGVVAMGLNPKIAISGLVGGGI